MADKNFRNADIHELVNDIYKNITGEEFTTVESSKLADMGSADFPRYFEQFTEAIFVNRVKTVFLNWVYEAERDVFFEDSDKFQAIIRTITITAPDAVENEGWQKFNQGDLIAGFKVSLPEIEAKYFGKTVSFELNITVSRTQWNDIVSSNSELESWIGQITLAIENKLKITRKQMNETNRNNFLAHKLNNYTTDEPTDVINLIKMYLDENGITTAGTYDAKWFMNNKDCLKFAIEKIMLYMGYIKQPTKLFNRGNKVVFTPTDRIVVEVLGAFEAKLQSIVESEVYHNNLVTLPNHVSVPSWQSMSSLDFSDVSKINAKIENLEDSENPYEVEQSGIVGFIADKWALMHTQMEQEVVSVYDKLRHLTHISWQYRDSYMNNLELNAIVFILDSVTLE